MAFFTSHFSSKDIQNASVRPQPLLALRSQHFETRAMANVKLCPCLAGLCQERFVGPQGKQALLLDRRRDAQTRIAKTSQ